MPAATFRVIELVRPFAPFLPDIKAPKGNAKVSLSLAQRAAKNGTNVSRLRFPPLSCPTTVAQQACARYYARETPSLWLRLRGGSPGSICGPQQMHCHAVDLEQLCYYSPSHARATCRFGNAAI